MPLGLIHKMYRKPVLIDEVNKILGESVADYFAGEKLYIIGEPLPHEDDSAEFDWENDSEFEFSFDIGLAPEVDIEVTEKDKLPFYSIKIDNGLIIKHIDQIQSRFGQLKEMEKISTTTTSAATTTTINGYEKPSL